MGNKIKLVYLLFFILLSPFCKQTKYEIRDQIKLYTEVNNIIGHELLVKTNVNILHDEIEEHGHCWSNFMEEPTIINSEFTCLGPLKNTKEFSEKLELEKGVFFIRAYLITNSYIVYGETITVTL